MKQTTNDSRESLIVAAILRHPNKSNSRIAAALHRHGLKAADIAKFRDKAGEQSKEGASGVSKKQFAALFDPETKCRDGIRSGIKTLGGDELIPDQQFRTQRCGMKSSLGWRQAAEQPEFAAYQCVTPGNKLWWAKPETINWAIENVQGTRRQ